MSGKPKLERLVEIPKDNGNMKTDIEDIKNSDYDSLLKAALISQAKKTIKEYCNQKDVVGFAINELREGANPQKVDDDWIALFMNQARLISDEVFQSIWGKILG